MKRIFSVLIIMLASFVLYADGITFVGKAPAKVGVGQRMQLQYTLNEKPTSIQLGKINGFKLVGGPSQSSSSSVSFVNGSMTSSSSYTYTYTLEATSEGTFTLGGAIAVVDGTKYTSNTVSVTVQKEAVQQQQQRQQTYYDPFEAFFGTGQSQQSQQQQPQNQPKTSVSADDVLLRVYSSKTNLMKGECAVVTIKLCTKIDLMSIEEFTIPKFDNFYVEELETSNNINWSRETINGKQYNTAVLKKCLVFPRVSGNLKIDQSDIKCLARVVSGRHPFWGYTYDNASVSAKSPEITLNVSNLPSAPSDFSGAVGKFNIAVSQPNDTVSVNEAVVCKITISGNGNFNTLEAPRINCPKEFESYDPVISEKINASESGLSGSKTWEYTLVPRYGGTFDLGAISFTYFDLASKSYKTISSENIVVNVRKGANDNSSSGMVYNPQAGVEIINPEDVRYIKKGNLNLVAAYSPLMCSGIYWLVIISLLVMFFIAVVIMRKKIKKRQNVELIKRQKANKISRKRLKQARKYMQSNNSEDFYKEIITALWGYAGDKFAIPTAQLTKDRILQVFAEHNIDSDLAKRFVELIDTCEFAHFVSGANSELQSIYDESTKIIEQLEENIR